MDQDSKQPHGLPDWVQNIGTRLKHDLNGDMTDMPEKLLLRLLSLFRREEHQAGSGVAGNNEPELREHGRESNEPR